MGLQIEDGLGRGFLVGVDSENRIHTTAVTQSIDEHVNQETGKVWSIPFGPLDPTDVNDYVVYIKNTGDKTISITDIRVSATGAASVMSLTGVTGTAVSGSTITPVSRTVGSSATMTAIVEGGVNITGITTSGTLFLIDIPVVATLYHLRTTSKVRIPKGQAVGLSVSVATSIVTGIVSIVEEE